MRTDWEIKSLGEVCCKITDGSHNPPKGVVSSEFLMLSSKNIFDDFIHYDDPRYLSKNDFEIENKRTSVQCKDVLMTIVGTIGRVATVPEYHPKFTLQRSVAVLRAKENLLNYRFLMYLLQNNLKYLTDESRGVAQKGIYLNQLRKIKVSLPSLLEQQRIVAILDEAFAAIDKAKANAEKNLKNAKELFESYLQGVFENGSWEKKKWGDLCEFVRGPFGGSLKKNMFKDDGYVVYEQKHAIHDHFNQLRYFIDEEKFNEMKRFELFPGDLIMSCSGVTLGRVAIVPEGIKRGIINQALLKLTPKKNVSVNFIKHWLRSRIFQNIIFTYAGGAAIPNVPSAKILKGILIPFPSLIEQERIIREIDEVLTETNRLESIYQQKLTDLEELKKSILQKAFNGELKTADICV